MFTTPASVSSAQFPAIKSGAKAAKSPSAPDGKPSTTNHPGLSKVAGFATSCELTLQPAGKLPDSKSSLKNDSTSPKPSHSAGASAKMGTKPH